MMRRIRYFLIQRCFSKRELEVIDHALYWSARHWTGLVNEREKQLEIYKIQNKIAGR